MLPRRSPGDREQMLVRRARRRALEQVLARGCRGTGQQVLLRGVAGVGEQERVVLLRRLRRFWGLRRLRCGEGIGAQSEERGEGESEQAGDLHGVGKLCARASKGNGFFPAALTPRRKDCACAARRQS